MHDYLYPEKMTAGWNVYSKNLAPVNQPKINIVPAQKSTEINIKTSFIGLIPRQVKPKLENYIYMPQCRKPEHKLVFLNVKKNWFQ